MTRYLSNDEIALYRVLDDIEYKKELLNKLKEECNEVIDAFAYGQSGDMVIELADVLEVLNYLAKSINVNMQEVDNVAMMKKMKNGGFEKNIIWKKLKKERNDKIELFGYNR